MAIREIRQDKERTFVECSCGNKFWCDPITEDNLERIKREQHIILIPCCSRCGFTDWDWAKRVYKEEGNGRG